MANTPCTELGRVTRAYVSAFTRDRIHDVQVMAQEKRCLVANFRGALESGRWIALAVWSVSNPMFANLAQAEITADGRETACLMLAQWRGTSLVRCTATMDNGDVYTQYFSVRIDGFWFQGDVPAVQGPYQISVVGAAPSSSSAFISISLSGALGNGAFKDVVSYQYTLAGGVLPRSVALLSGSLPAGLSIYATGLAAGTRGVPGTYNFSLVATDGNGNTFTLPDVSTTISTDLLTWNTVADGDLYVPNWSWIHGSIAIIADTTVNLIVSTDSGLTWSLNNVSAAIPNGAGYVIRYNGDWYVFDWTGTQAAKTTGDVLTFTSFSNAPQIRSVGILDGYLYAGANSPGPNYLLTKMVTPGVAWMSIDTGIALASVNTGIACMVRTPTSHVFATLDGAILRSTDMVTFTKPFFDGTKIFSSIAYLNGVIIAACSNGYYISTNDGVTWSVLQSTIAIINVVATPSMFIGASVTTIYTSPDGVAWTSRITQSYGAYSPPPSTDGVLALFPINGGTGWASVGSP